MRKPRNYTPDEVAEIAKVTRRTVYEWLRTDQLEGVKAGPRLWRIPEAALNRFLADRSAFSPSGQMSAGDRAFAALEAEDRAVAAVETIKRPRGRPKVDITAPMTKERYDYLARQDVRKEVIRALAAGESPRYTLADYPPFNERRPSRAPKPSKRDPLPSQQPKPEPALFPTPPTAKTLFVPLDIRSAKQKPKGRRH